MRTEKRTIWKRILELVITVLTTIAGTLGITSCMG